MSFLMSILMSFALTEAFLMNISMRNCWLRVYSWGITFHVDIGPPFPHELTRNSVFHEDLLRLFHEEREFLVKNLTRSSWKNWISSWVLLREKWASIHVYSDSSWVNSWVDSRVLFSFDSHGKSPFWLIIDRNKPAALQVNVLVQIWGEKGRGPAILWLISVYTCQAVSCLKIVTHTACSS